MKTENNAVDILIKKDLRIEIIYRTIPWSIVSVSTYLIFSSHKDFSLITYYSSTINKSIDLVNMVLPISMILLILSALFKDMECRSQKHWSQEKPLGIFGSLLRKLCSELLLWGCGLSFGMIIITIITMRKVISDSGIPDENLILKVGYLIFLFLLMFLMNSLFYVICRKEGATIFESAFKDEKYIPLFYALAVLGCVGYIYIGI